MMHTRVLDAQNYMVPQRRKRQFMVLLLRGAWQAACVCSPPDRMRQYAYERLIGEASTEPMVPVVKKAMKAAWKSARKTSLKKPKNKVFWKTFLFKWTTRNFKNSFIGLWWDWKKGTVNEC